MLSFPPDLGTDGTAAAHAGGGTDWAVGGVLLRALHCSTGETGVLGRQGVRP